MNFRDIKPGAWLCCLLTGLSVMRGTELHASAASAETPEMPGVGTVMTLHFAVALAVIAVLLLLLYIIRYRRHFRQRMNEKGQQLKNYEQILITTVADTYKAIRSVDLETGEAEHLFFEAHHIRRQAEGSYQNWLEEQRRFIHAQDCRKVLEVISLEHLRALPEGVRETISYRSAKRNEGGHFKTYTTNISITRLNDRPVAILTTIDTSVAVINEKAQRRILTAAASIYIAMFAIDLEEETFEMISSDARARRLLGNRRTGDKDMLIGMFYRLTDEQYREEMVAFTDFSTLDERMKGTPTITFEYPDVNRGWCRARFIVVNRDRSSHLTRVLWAVENIDAEKRRANRLLYLSETDLMTGLRNRGSGEKRIKDLIADDHEGIFCLMDVDKFKSVNDTFGHCVGDKVLIAVADCLKHSFRETDIVMRLGGDEFAVFVDDITEQETAAEMFRTLFANIAAIDIPELGDRKLTVSMGAAVRRRAEGWDFETLYRNADMNTYKSKKIPESAYSFYSEDDLLEET